MVGAMLLTGCTEENVEAEETDEDSVTATVLRAREVSKDAAVVAGKTREYTGTS